MSVLLADVVRACTCESPSLQEAVEYSPNIAILKLISVEKYKDGEKGYGYGGIKQSKFTVQKVFKGNLKTGQELNFIQGGGGNCILAFTEDIVGVEFLLFLDKKPGKKGLWQGFVCSRSSSVKGASADLMYLERLSQVKGRTRLAGTLIKQVRPAVEGQDWIYNRLAEHSVRIIGNGKDIEIKTDKNGVYEIYDLPVGKYKVTPAKVDGFKFDDEESLSVEVEIEEGSIKELDFDFQIDNSISGKFLDSNGKPLQGVGLDLIPISGKKARYFYKADSTDEQGNFSFDEIPNGTYLIVVNEENQVTAREPFGTFYYPNTIKREEAKAITIEAGQHLRDLIITAPTTAETIEISGVLLFEDGKPVVGESVEFFQKPAQDRRKYESADSRSRTDENGRFKLRILKGQKGYLFGSFSTYLGKYVNCSKMDKLIKAKGEKHTNLETESLFFEAQNDLREVEFRFQFPSCKKKYNY